MLRFDGLLISVVVGLGLGFVISYFIRRRLGASRARKAASAPKVYASRQEMRKQERARMKAERSARKRAGD